MYPHKPYRSTVAVLAGALTTGIVLAALAGRAGARPLADERPAPELVKAFKEADLVFTAKVAKVMPVGRTNSIPPSTFGDVTFKEVQALRGKAPEPATFSYTYKEGTTKHVDLKSEGLMVVAVKGKAVSAVVPATEANLALARTPEGK